MTARGRTQRTKHRPPHAPKGERAQAADAARAAAVKDKCDRWVNNMMGYRRVCGNPACTRSKGCAGDPVACFNRFWPITPEAHKVWLRAIIRARTDGLPVTESMRAAAAEVERAAEHIAYVDAQVMAGIAARDAAAAAKRKESATSPLAPRSGERVPSECEAGEGQDSREPLTRHPHADALGCHPLPASQGEGKRREPRIRFL